MFSFVEGAVTTPSQLLRLLPQNFSVGGAVTKFSDYVFIFQNSHWSASCSLPCVSFKLGQASHQQGLGKVA